MSKSREEARNQLDEELRPIFDQLVDEYKFYCLQFYKNSFVSYKILAALVESGWHPSDKELSDSQHPYNNV